MKVTTLSYIEKDNKYLMLYRNKKKNDDNAGKWIGIGGKLEPDETIDQCMVREIKEETGLDATKYFYHGVVHFISDTFSEDMHLFTVTGFTGKVDYNCPEGELRWIDKDEVLSLPIWEGDRVFLERIIEGKNKFTLTLRYEGERLADVDLVEG